MCLISLGKFTKTGDLYFFYFMAEKKYLPSISDIQYNNRDGLRLFFYNSFFIIVVFNFIVAIIHIRLLFHALYHLKMILSE
jgi:hypothetical protein